MKRKLTMTLFAVTMLIVAIALTGCGEQESAQKTALEGVDKGAIPQEGYEAYGIRQSHNKEVTMIAALKEYREDLKKEGRKQGRKEGRKEGRKDTAAVFMQLFNAGRADDVQRAVREPEYLDKLMAEFGYSDDDNKDDANQS